jgi:hypothetical protein
MDYRTVVYGGVVLFHAFMFITRKKKWLPQWAAVNDRNERKKEEKRIA